MITMAILFTMITAVFTASIIPVNAQSLRAESFSVHDYDDYVDYDDDDWDDDDYFNDDEDWDDDDGCETWDIDDNEYRTVKGTKHFLALRTQPSYSDSNIIGKLYNGEKVVKTDRRSGEYVWVYSPDLDCSGWVNASYLK